MAGEIRENASAITTTRDGTLRHRYLVKDERGQLVGFDQLYDTYFNDIFRHILFRVANVADAEDLTAQTFFKALRNIKRFRWRGGSLSGWLYRIATNEVNAYYRKRKSMTAEDDLLERPDGRGGPQDELETAERSLARHQIFLTLNTVITRMKPEEQTLIVLRYLERKPFAEIAKILGKREGALTMRTHRALKKLKSELEKRGIDHEKIRRGFDEPVVTGYPGRQIQTGITP